MKKIGHKRHPEHTQTAPLSSMLQFNCSIQFVWHSKNSDFDFELVELE